MKFSESSHSVPMERIPYLSRINPVVGMSQDKFMEPGAWCMANGSLRMQPR